MCENMYRVQYQAKYTRDSHTFIPKHQQRPFVSEVFVFLAVIFIVATYTYTLVKFAYIFRKQGVLKAWIWIKINSYNVIRNMPIILLVIFFTALQLCFFKKYILTNL